MNRHFDDGKSDSVKGNGIYNQKHSRTEHESAISALLQRHTPMQVMQAEDGTKVEENCVYVIPPGKHLTSLNGHLQLTDLEPERGKRVAAMDLDRRITSWNSGAQRILGYTQEGALGQSANIIFTPEDRATRIPEREAAKALADGRASDEPAIIR